MSNWFETQRLDWIAETLRVFGFINREHLERKFGISQPQASNDLQRFLRANPDAMTYDLSGKRYVATVAGQMTWTWTLPPARTKKKQAKKKD